MCLHCCICYVFIAGLENTYYKIAACLHLHFHAGIWYIVELYDGADEDELESLDAHGSIVKHLISQVVLQASAYINNNTVVCAALLLEAA